MDVSKYCPLNDDRKVKAGANEIIPGPDTGSVRCNETGLFSPWLVTWCNVVFSISVQSHVFALSCTLCLSWQATVWKQSIKEESLRAFVMMVFSPVGSLLFSLLCIFSHLQLDVFVPFPFCLHDSLALLTQLRKHSEHRVLHLPHKHFSSIINFMP